MPQPVLDRPLALSRVGGDEELLKEIAVIFLDDCPRLMAELRDAIAANDPQKLESAAHSMKGSVGNFGAEAAVSAAFNLERMGRERRATSQALDSAATSEFEALQQALSVLRLELEAL